MEKIKTLTTLEEIKVFSDPYRLQILRCFSEIDEPATVKQIADKMGEVPAKVHYHVKKMEKIGILELVFTREINGIIAKYYSPTAEQFTIKNSNYEAPMFKDFMNKTQKLLSNVFDDAKRIFLEQLESYQPNRCKKEPEDGFITSGYLYLTKEQYKEAQNYIKKLTDDNAKKVSNESEKYFLFTSMMKIDDERNGKR